MSARAWQRRRGGQWGERPSYERWIPQHPGMTSPSIEMMLYGSYVTEKVWERPINRSRRLRAERFARRQRRRHPRTPEQLDAVLTLIRREQGIVSPELESFIHDFVSASPLAWSLPDADPLADMRAMFGWDQPAFKPHAPVAGSPAQAERFQIAGYHPVALYLDETLEPPDA